MEPMINILLVDDETSIIRTLERQLRSKYKIFTAPNAEAGLAILEKDPIHVILSDERMPGMTGVEFLELCHKTRPDVVRIILSGFADTTILKKAINNSHVHGFINKPVNIAELNLIIENQLKEMPISFGIVGKSKKIQDIIKLIYKASRTDSTILVTGESGTGKELVARAVYSVGKRKGKSYVVENCAAITQSILEAELFGHVKGSFTGATIDKPGLFEMADKGILVLDEIGDLNKDMQTKLLRVIENGTFRKVGGTKNINVDVQLIFSTNKDLLAEVENGNFRKDLYYRINVINIHIPPLRERLVDIPLLTRHFSRIFGLKLEKEIVIDQEVIEAFMDYHWPGNVRELEHEIERAVAIADTDQISLKHLTIKKQKNTGSAEKSFSEEVLPEGFDGGDFYNLVAEYEKKLIRYALSRTKGSKRKASMILNMTRQSLCNKISKYNLDLK